MILAAKLQTLLLKQFQLLPLSQDKDQALRKELQYKLTDLIPSIRHPKLKSPHPLNPTWSLNKQLQPDHSLNNTRLLLKQETMWDSLANRTQTHKVRNNNTTAISQAQAKNSLSLLRKLSLSWISSQGLSMSSNKEFPWMKTVYKYACNTSEMRERNKPCRPHRFLSINTTTKWNSKFITIESQQESFRTLENWQPPSDKESSRSSLTLLKAITTLQTTTCTAEATIASTIPNFVTTWKMIMKDTWNTITTTILMTWKEKTDAFH